MKNSPFVSFFKTKIFSQKRRCEKIHLKLDTAFLTPSITFYSILKLKTLRNESEHPQSYFSLSINLSNKKDGLLKSIHPFYPAIYFLRGPLVAPPHASIMTKTNRTDQIAGSSIGPAFYSTVRLTTSLRTLKLPKATPSGEKRPLGHLRQFA
ncbi:hypothetical protein ACM5ME_21135 [Bacillus subtilis]|uniref:hypothetical protein n=1 Tax=Bacillus subtilis TaxID=1423 RepID=UPI003AADD6AB